MPDITEHPSSHITKALLIGESGTGKTGALASLAAAGFNLRILDLDNGLDILRNLITKSGSRYAPALQPGRVTFQTLTEPMRQVGGNMVPRKAEVWEKMTGLLDKWIEYELKDGERVLGPDGKPIIRKDLGSISSWGSNDVLVLDSLTRAADAAFNFDWKLQGKLGIPYTQNEHRRAIGRAQGFVENLLQALYSSAVPCNVIVISHITYIRDNEAQGELLEGEDYPKKGYPSALGVALSPRIPRYFNTVLYTRTIGTGSAARQRIYTKPMGIVNVKSSAPLSVKPEYPIESGLADYFKDVRS